MKTNKGKNVILFDEAQRAWDEKKMGSNISEADALLAICDKIYNSKQNVTLVCFVGDDQSIHEGEEKRLKTIYGNYKRRSNRNIKKSKSMCT